MKATVTEIEAENELDQLAPLAVTDDTPDVPDTFGSLNVPRELSDEQKASYGRIPTEVDCVLDESFEARDAEARFFGPNAEEIEIPVWTTFPEVAEDATPVKGRRGRLKGDEEATLFRRYNYARWRLGKLVTMQVKHASAERARQMIRWHRRAMKCRSQLVRANLALVLAMAKRTRIPNVDFGEVVSEGNMALLRSVEKFDVSRGFKFSTYACRAILKSFNRLATKTGRYRQRFPVEYDPELEQSDYDVRRHEMQRADSVETLREVLLNNRAELSDVERTVVMERFAIGNAGKPHTLSEVGQMIGLTNERVRQIQNHALTKLKAALVEEGVAA